MNLHDVSTFGLRLPVFKEYRVGDGLLHGFAPLEIVLLNADFCVISECR